MMWKIVPNPTNKLQEAIPIPTISFHKEYVPFFCFPATIPRKTPRITRLIKLISPLTMIFNIHIVKNT